MIVWIVMSVLAMSWAQLPSPGMVPSRTGVLPPSAFGRYLDAAVMLIKSAKSMKPLMEIDTNQDRSDEDINMPDSWNVRCPSRPMDCEELMTECSRTVSGVYRIFPRSRLLDAENAGFDVYCDMETDGGGWTVIQRRDDFGSESDFFFKNWQNYKIGFGDLNYDYWLGNDKIFGLSNQRRTALRIDLVDFNDQDGWATYNDFYLDDERQGYRLHIGEYTGIIGDSFRGHNLMRFSTRDRDNDNNRYQNCAQLYKGGWWYNNCHTANLNGLYLKGNHDTYADGVNWYGWKGFRYSLRRTEMKVRSVDFKTDRTLPGLTDDQAGLMPQQSSQSDQQSRIGRERKVLKTQ